MGTIIAKLAYLQQRAACIRHFGRRLVREQKCSVCILNNVKYTSLSVNSAFNDLIENLVMLFNG